MADGCYAVVAVLGISLAEAMAMGPDAGGRYSYTAGRAKIYSSLGVEGTTYEIGYDRVRELLGDSITGRIFLDFGCGTGRSTAFLRALGARHVYGVDHDQDMINVARAASLDGAEFFLIAGTVPLPDESVDGAVSMNVFIEIRTMDAMRRACEEVARVLRREGVFIVMSASPAAFGHTFRSFGYPATGHLQSGSLTRCIVTAPGGQFCIDDTYWAEDDYRDALLQAGFSVTAIDYPRPHDPSGWSTDEATIPPFVVIKAIKQN